MGLLDVLGDALARVNTKKPEYGPMSPELAAQYSSGGLTGGLLRAVNPMMFRDDSAWNRWVKSPVGTPMGREAMQEALPALVGIFAGPNAKTADLTALAKAERLAAGGADNEAIRQATGWFKGMDGKWRFEIDDSSMRQFSELPKSPYAKSPVAGDVFDAKLFDAYPDLKTVPTMASDIAGERAAYMRNVYGNDPASPGVITFNPSHGTLDRRYDALHELQHAIQEREGFARGGSPENASMYTPEFDLWSRLRGAKTPEEKAAYRAIPSDWDAYQRLAGEIEARDVSARMNLTPEQRLATPPDLRPDAIVRYGSGPQMSVPGYVEDAATREANFKKWFGDSKVVDAEGKPLTVYHGTRDGIEEFSRDKINTGVGFFFTGQPGTARGYADRYVGRGKGTVIPAHLSIKNPLDLSTEAGKRVNEEIKQSIGDGLRGAAYKDAYVDAARSRGYDGMLMLGRSEIVAFDPTQIKSTLNRGTYDPTEPNIFKSLIPAAATAYGIDQVLPYD